MNEQQLLDRGARVELEAAGHDVVWTGSLPPDPGDEEIPQRALV